MRNIDILRKISKIVSKVFIFAFMATEKNKLSMRDRFPMNISKELFNTWQQLRRTGDPAKLQKALKLSRPIVDRALNYGNAKNEVTADRISKFFSDRIAEEKANGGSVKLGKASKKLLETVNS